MILLDTNVVSELMRPDPDAKVGSWLAAMDTAPLATSAISIAEIVFGLCRLPDGKRRSSLIERFDTLLAGPPALPVLALDEQAGRLAGEFHAIRENLGRGSTPSDMMIAAIAMTHGANLATRNVGDFSGLPIRVVDPWA
ncbi:MAG: type II toxin-antitoxin system VapC family toxin [Micropepsaceae bacterium]